MHLMIFRLTRNYAIVVMRRNSRRKEFCTEHREDYEKTAILPISTFIITIYFVHIIYVIL